MDLLENIKNTGFLRVGTTADYFPLSYIDSESCNFKGSDIDFAVKLGQSIGVKVEFIKTSWPNLEQDLLEGKFNLAVGGITITEERCKKFLMSKGYRKTGKTILCRKIDEKKFSGLNDVNNSSVLVMYNPGGTNEKFVLEKLNLCKKIMHPVNEKIPKLIAEGKADVMITETVEADYYIRVNRKLAAPLINKPFTQDEFGVLMTKENTALLEIVNSIIQ